MGSLESIMLLKKVAEEYCEKRKYSIYSESISYCNECLTANALDTNRIKHALKIRTNRVELKDVFIEDECTCEYSKPKNIFVNNEEMELFRGKNFKVEISNLWMDVYSKLLFEAGKRNMEEKGGVWLDYEMYVAELANMYCDINDTYDMDKIERFIEKEFA